MKKALANKFKGRLEAEKDKLLSELQSIGRINPENPGDWEAVPPNREELPTDENEIADHIEEFEENAGILKQLEIQLKEVQGALDRIAGDNYGVCEVCGELIEEGRLEANAAAKTCTKHMK